MHEPTKPMNVPSGRIARDARVEQPAVLAVVAAQAVAHAERLARVEVVEVGVEAVLEVLEVDRPRTTRPDSCSSVRPVNRARAC
jgi:hypothetical protein